MATMHDQAYLKLCAELASCLSISLASARKKVEIAAAKKGINDLSSRKNIAEGLLKAAHSSIQDTENTPASELDKLLTALAEDENFMVED